MRIILFSFLVLILSSCGDDSVSGLGGNGQGSDNQTSICTNCRVFVTASAYNGNLGGISGADQKCANDANKPTDGGTFKALVVSSTRRACTSAYCNTSGIGENSNWVMKANTTYKDLNGNELFTTNASAIAEFPVFSNIQGLVGDKVWTGLEMESDEGFMTTSAWLTGENCGDWLDENAGGGRVGENMFTNPNQGYYNFSDWTDSCGTMNPLYCIEQ